MKSPSPACRTRLSGYDIIGDIHGCQKELETLLLKLGYTRTDGVWRHADRLAVFCGDLVDRGPEIRAVLETVRAMVDAGTAVCLLGNHERDLIFWCVSKADGKPLRAHSEVRAKQMKATFKQLGETSPEMASWIDWIRGLPLTFEVPGLRVVHAAWNADAIHLLRGRTLSDPGLLVALSDPNSPESLALGDIVFGPVLNLPRDDRIEHVRARWWVRATRANLTDYRRASVHRESKVPTVELPAAESVKCWGYPRSAPVLLFGHQALRMRGRPRPFRRNVGCVDYAAVYGGRLCAYRWSGESYLDSRNYVWVPGWLRPKSARKRGAAARVCESECTDDCSEAPVASTGTARASSGQPDAFDALLAAYDIADRKPAGLSRLELKAWRSSELARAGDLGLRFAADHPTDPRRWVAMALALSRSPTFEKISSDEKTGRHSLIADPAAVADWSSRLTTAVDTLRTGSDVPASARALVLEHDYGVRRAMLARGDWDGCQRLARQTLVALESVANEATGNIDGLPTVEKTLASFTRTFWTEYRGSDNRADCLPDLRRLAVSSWPAVASAAGKYLVNEETIGSAFELAVTTHDGVVIDIKSLRGQVVLVEFWTLGCPGCRKEFTAIRAVYGRYREQGFAVIGILLASAEEHGKALAYLAEHGITWPQYIEVAGFESPLVRRYGVSGVPSLFLLNREGIVIANHSRGSRLEPAVRNLLGLPPLQVAAPMPITA